MGKVSTGVALGLLFAVGIAAFAAVATQTPVAPSPDAEEVPDVIVHNTASGVAAQAGEVERRSGEFHARVRVANEGPSPTRVVLAVDAHGGDALLHSDARPNRQALSPSESFTADVRVDGAADRIDVYVDDRR